MFARPSAKYVAVELAKIREKNWLDRIDEDRTGHPQLIPGTSTSGNLIHHSYHLLRFAEVTGVEVSAFNQVVEIGGGYGSMCRLISRLFGPDFEAVIFDLPEFSVLQRYFLRMVGVRARTVSNLRDIPAQNSQTSRLLLATWSLSEMSIADRLPVLDAVGPCNGYLIAFQSEFEEIDNTKFFADWSRATSGTTWYHDAIPQIPRSNYLFGIRDRAT